MIDAPIDDLALHMHDARVAYLSALFDRCRRRFVEAARLLERAEAQLAMFDDSPSAAEAFSRWVYWELWPSICMDGGVVRAVLCATGALPADDRAVASYYLVGHVRGMSIAPKLVALDPENLDLL